MRLARRELDRFPVAILGLGFAGSRLHLPALRRLGAEVVLAADPDPSTHDRAPGISTSRDWRRVLESDAAAVIIATSPERHAEPALAALSAGKHVYVEKPMATSTAQAHELAEAAERSGLSLQVGFAYRFHPLWQRVRRMLQAGRLAPPLRFEAEFTAASSETGCRDPALDLGVHHLDLASWLLDAPPASVRAADAELELTWRDGSALTGRYRVGPPLDRVRVIAGQRALEVDRLNGWRLHGRSPLREGLPPVSLARARLTSRDWDRSFEFALRAFLRSAAGLAPRDGAGPQDGVASAAVTEAIVAARASGLPHSVDPSPRRACVR
jgi:predicted dehydrogenase